MLLRSRTLARIVNRPLEPFSSRAPDSAFEPLSDLRAPSLPTQINPDDPPWNVPVALFVWVMSVLLIFFVQLVGIALYLLMGSQAQLQSDQLSINGVDPTIILIGAAATFPAHLLTLMLVWIVVTGTGRRPFWQTIGWKWTGKLQLLMWMGIAAAVWVLSQAIAQSVAKVFGAEETALEVLIKSSPEARVVIALMAVLTAPLIEEIVYRGILYPAFQRTLGVVWAVCLVAAIFAGVHFQQYQENPGVVVGVTILSLTLTIVRARTGSVLPGFIIHLIFNGITAVLLLLYPNLEGLQPKQPPTSTVAVVTASHTCRN